MLPLQDAESISQSTDSLAPQDFGEIPRKYHDLDPVVGGRELIPA